MNNFFISKFRRVVNGIPLTLMEKVIFMQELGAVTDIPTTAVLHSSLLGLEDPAAHSQYALSGDVLTRIQEVAAAAQNSISALRTAIVTGDLEVAEANLGNLAQLAINADFARTADTVTNIAGIPLSTTPPNPDNVLAYEPVSNTLIWRSIIDLVDHSELELAIEQNAAAIVANSAAITALAADVATNTSDILSISVIIDEYALRFNSDYIKSKLLHLTFNSAGSGVDDFPLYPDEAHGLQWQDHDASDLSNFYGIDVGNQTAYGYHWSDVTNISMRFTMSNSANRGWVWSVKGGSPAYKPRMALSQAGQLSIHSGFTFVNTEPKFFTSATTAESKHGYILTYNSGTSAITLQASAGSSTTDHGSLTGLADDDHLQYHTDVRAETWLTGSVIDGPITATTFSAGTFVYCADLWADQIWVNPYNRDANSEIFFHDGVDNFSEEFQFNTSTKLFDLSSTLNISGEILATGGSIGNMDVDNAGEITNATIEFSSNTVDGDHLQIDYVPSLGYTANTATSEATSTDQLTAHLLGIALALQTNKNHGNLDGLDTAADDDHPQYERRTIIVTAITTDHTIVETDRRILADASAADLTVSLPASSSVSGREYNIKKTDATSNKVTIDPSGSETIDGELTLDIIFQYDAVTVTCDGSNWHIT